MMNKWLLGFCGVFVAFFAVGAGVALAADQMKTVEFYVYDHPSALSGPASESFDVYIGDNISGVASPVKSAYFMVSGVYTGGGSITMTLNSANSKTFTLPSVSVPTYFEVMYKDAAGIINPSTGGTYSYTFGLNPSGVTLYGTGAELYLTYRYTPSSCPDGTGEKIKTLMSYVYDNTSALSSTVNPSFNVYIGDNISGVTDPVKSAFFRVSGVYTGGGTVTLTLNSLNSTTFTLPSVSTPTTFQFFYEDSAGLINPLTAGTYSYTFGLNPSGVTLYGLGVDNRVTYRYSPNSCTGLPITGELTSMVFDTTGTDSLLPAYNSFVWNGSLNGGTGRVRFQLATSNNAGGPWNYYGSSDNGVTCSSGAWYDPGDPDTPVEIACSSEYHNDQRYFRYKIQLCSHSDCSSVGAVSPQVDDVIVNWSP